MYMFIMFVFITVCYYCYTFKCFYINICYHDIVIGAAGLATI